MKELTKPISEVRQKLPALARAAEQRMERVVITQQGRAQAVLMGYEDYLGMKTAVELLSRPELADGMAEASAELARGEGVPLDELKVALPKYVRRVQAMPLYDSPSSARRGLGLHEIKAHALLNKGNALTNLGKPDEAIASYNELLEMLSQPEAQSKP